MNELLSGGQFQKVKPRKPTATGQSTPQYQSLSPAACQQYGQVTALGSAAIQLPSASLNSFHRVVGVPSAGSCSSTSRPQCGQVTGPITACPGTNTLRVADTSRPLTFRPASSSSWSVTAAA